VGRNPSSFAKRQRERERQRKRAEKAARRAERRERDNDGPDTDDGVDPDIAGIVPGPQPHPFLEEEKPGERQKEAPTIDEIAD
jgi:hypothetical protein